VRHRVGWAYSQVSQRFVDGTTLRFVERPEYVADATLHGWFEEDIDRAAARYGQIAEYLVGKQAAGDQLLQGEKRRDLRKKVNSCARSRLPNETEAPIIVSCNPRSLRHFIEMRAAGPADIEIRAVALRMFLCAQAIEPTLLSDYDVITLPDGTNAVAGKNIKV
jgi:thymidylate synthase (FAD)